MGKRDKADAPRKFRYRFSPLIIALMVLVLAAALAGGTLNIIRAASKSFMPTVWNVMSVAIMLLTCTALIVIVVGLFISSYYVFKGDKLVTRYGVIKSEMPVRSITEVVFFKKTEKLVIYFDTDKYTVIVVREIWYDDFVKELRKINPAVRYDSRTSPDEDEPNDK